MPNGAEGLLPIVVVVRPCREVEASIKSLVASERDRPDVAHPRAQWQKYQGQIDPERLVFIDESLTYTNMATLRGLGAVRHQAQAKVPHGHWKTSSFLAALRYDRIEAPRVLDGPIDGESFTIEVDIVLLSTL